MAINNSQYGLIRQFSPGDLGRVIEIASDSLTEYYTNGLILDLYEAWPQAFMVFDSGFRVDGFLIGSRHTQSEARILIFAIDPKLRNRGIGALLMNEFLGFCGRSNFMSIRLEVRTDNDSAINFYKKFGFVVTSRLKAYYSDSSDAYTMWRIV